MKKMKTVLMAVMMVPLFVMAKQKTILINSEQQDCIGFDNMRIKCLEYKEKGKDNAWRFLYQPIKGFRFEPGYLYTLLINETVPIKISDTANTHVTWTLVKLVKKVRVPVMEYGELIRDKKGISGDWLFTKMMEPGQTMDFISKKEMIRFDVATKKVNGKASCNSFFGTYAVTGYEIKFGPLGSTMMACPNLETERKMMKALETVNQWEIKGNTLLLKNADTVVFELVRVVKKTV